MSDLIRREDLVKELNAQFAVGDITREIANDILNHIPSAEPDREMGWWQIKETAYEDVEAKCSCCGFETLVNQPGNGLHMVNDLHFCPNCGAKMDWSEG